MGDSGARVNARTRVNVTQPSFFREISALQRSATGEAFPNDEIKMITDTSQSHPRPRILRCVRYAKIVVVFLAILCIYKLLDCIMQPVLIIFFLLLNISFNNLSILALLLNEKIEFSLQLYNTILFLYN